MNRLHFRLEKVLKLRQDERDACLARLAAAQARLREVNAQQQAVQRALSAERGVRRECSAAGPLNLAQLQHQCRHAAGLQAELQRIEVLAGDAAREAEQRERDLQAADRALGILQKLREWRYAQFVAAENAREQGRLDEAAARSHRKHAEGLPC